jgi:HK97 gp10 family phage protein
MSVRAEFKDLAELLNKIDYLGNSDARSVFRAGASAGARVVKRYAQASAPGPGISITTKSTAEHASADIGPVKSKWYYQFAESGTKAHGPKRQRGKFMAWRESGKLVLAKRVRGVQARPFLKPALENHLQEIQDAIVEGYKKRLEKVSR